MPLHLLSASDAGAARDQEALLEEVGLDSAAEGLDSEAGFDSPPDAVEDSGLEDSEPAFSEPELPDGLDA
jgi:hypothetical protein